MYVAQPVMAKQVGEAVNEVLNPDTTDPNGFRLMIGCIALLFFLVSTIIGGTVWYMVKGQKSETDLPDQIKQVAKHC